MSGEIGGEGEPGEPGPGDLGDLEAIWGGNQWLCGLGAVML